MHIHQIYITMMTCWTWHVKWSQVLIRSKTTPTDRDLNNPVQRKIYFWLLLSVKYNHRHTMCTQCKCRFAFLLDKVLKCCLMGCGEIADMEFRCDKVWSSVNNWSIGVGLCWQRPYSNSMVFTVHSDMWCDVQWTRRKSEMHPNNAHSLWTCLG